MIVATLVSVMIAVSPVSAKPQQELALRLAARSQRFADSLRMPGLAVGVLMNGQIVYRAGFGSTRLVGGQPVTPRTVFHTASVTKPFVATAIMQLVMAGRIDLDAPVRRYIPYFKMRDPRAVSLTVRHLLTHTGGVDDATDYHWERPEYDAKSLERYIRGLADSGLISAPGEKPRYSSMGFEILSDVIAKVSGESFDDYVQRHILTPLGMRKSTLLMTDIDSSLMAWGHTGETPGAYRAAPHYPYNRRHAASSTLHSNVDDLLRWALANINGGTLEGVTILPPSAYDQLWKMQYDLTTLIQQGGGAMPFERAGFGLSWFLETRSGERLVYHDGQDLGFRSSLIMAPDRRSAVVVLINAECDPSELSRALLDMATRESPKR